MSHPHRHSPPGTHEHEYEPQRGLPERLPDDERLLWQGSPSAWAMARDAFHIRGLTAYFVVLLGLNAAAAWRDGASFAGGLAAVGWVLPMMVAFVLGVVWAAAVASARLAVYTITSRRVVMRIGIVLTVSYNFPFKQMLGAGLHLRRDGSGDIALQLVPNTQTSQVNLWPHARPWHWRQPQPLMRGLRDAQAVAGLLTQAWSAVQQGDQVAVASAASTGLTELLPTAQPSAEPRTSGRLLEATA
jgi:hypothetical protein